MDNLGVNLYKIQMMYFFKENSDFKRSEEHTSELQSH